MRGKAKNRLIGTKSLPFRVVALRIYFHVPGRGRLSGFCTKESGSCFKCFDSVKPEFEIFGNPIL